ncbi:DNA polymerase I [Clostridiaceae bacterium HFYG-1003]|nr:DNA polymerase I [Clostridiaceae bacterium HFYG-1003]
MEKLLIIDSNSIMNRAYFALPPMVTQDGLHTNAIYGYINMLQKIREELNPDFIVATFDRKAPTFRHQQYDNYKAGRKGMDDELAQQLAPMKEILTAMSISILEIDGYEADDLIGTLSLEAEKHGIESYIMTGDKDNLQLASDLTRVIITKKGITEKEVYDGKRFREEFGITPTQFIDVKGLMGDKSDNIPGVPGIGEKTAMQLVRDYGSIEGVYEHLDAITKPKQKQNLLEYREDAFFSKKLATILREVPIEINLEELRDQNGYNEERLRELYLRFQFRTLLNRLGKSSAGTAGQVTQPAVAPAGAVAETKGGLETKAEPAPVGALAALSDFRVAADAAGLASLEAQLRLKGDEPLLLSFLYQEDAMLSRREINVIYAVCGDLNLVLDFPSLRWDQAAMEILRRILEDHRIRKLGYNVKNAYTICKKHGIRFDRVEFDVLMAAYILEPVRGQYSLKDLISTYLFKEVEGEGHAFELAKTRELKELSQILAREIQTAGADKLLYEVELPLTNILSDLEIEGFRIDRDLLDEAGRKMQGEIARIQAEIYEAAGEEFNISSPKQLGVILFEKLDLPHGKKTKTGYSTNQAVLDTLVDKHPIIEKVMYYRQITKLYSTYVEGLRNAIDEDGRIHSNFQQTLAVTGRLSSTEPNLQNIPIRYEMGRELRKAFIPHDENCLIFASDYSQIELRVLAHLSDDASMQQAFASGVDIHTKTAAEVFGKTTEEVTSKDRSNAKAVNFGIIYGIGDFALSQGLGISRAEARTYIDMYYDRYPRIRDYFEGVKREAREKGYVTTIMGRRRQIPEINASNKVVQALGVRLAMNSPIQGSAADIIKAAMVKVYDALRQHGLKSRMILQVHDEIIINMHKDEEAIVRELVADAMAHAMDLKVELKSDQNTGGNWYEAK